MSEDIVTIKLTAATVIDGKIQRAGTTIEMVEDEAKSLMRLGKARLVAEPQTAVPTSNAAQVAAAQAAAAAVKPTVAPAPVVAPVVAPAAPVAAATPVAPAQ